MNQLVPFTGRTPALVAAGGERASYRYFEFFTANIRNPHTPRAYARAAVEFFDWLAAAAHRPAARRLWQYERIGSSGPEEPEYNREKAAPIGTGGNGG